jgi:ATP-binding cassette subfamily B protein
MLNDLTNVRLLFGAALLNVINTIIAYAVALPLMWSESPRLLLIALAPYPIMIAAMTVLGRFIFRNGVIAGQRLGEVSNLINEDLGARMYIAASGMQQVQARRFAAANDAYLDVNMRLVRLRAMGFPLTGALGALGIALTLFYGGKLVIQEQLTLGALVAFISYVAMLAGRR